MEANPNDPGCVTGISPYCRTSGKTGSYLAPLEHNEQFGLFVLRNKGKRPVMKIDSAHIRLWQKQDLVQNMKHATSHLEMSAAGRAFMRRLFADQDAFRAQHQIQKNTVIMHGEEHIKVRRNMGETPLSWLRARGNRSGVKITDIEFEAGEKLRDDFEAGHMHQCVSMDWSLTATNGKHKRRIGGYETLPHHAMEARKRMRAALTYAGPGLSDILLTICCELHGIEESEEKFGWPRRSGKLMLKLALARLTVFYGLQSESDASASLRMR